MASFGRCCIATSILHVGSLCINFIITAEKSSEILDFANNYTLFVF